MKITEQKYKTAKLKCMREWRNKLKKQGYTATPEELEQMWGKYDTYEVVESIESEKTDWCEVRKKKGALYWKEVADLHKKSQRNTVTYHKRKKDGKFEQAKQGVSRLRK